MRKVFWFLLGLFFLGTLIVYFFFPISYMKNLYQEVDVHDETVTSLYELANPSNDLMTMEPVYTKSGFSNEFILGASLAEYIKEHPFETTISENDVNIMVHRIFGNVTYGHDSGYIVSDFLCAFRYDKGSHTYSYVKGCTGKTDKKLLRKIVQAKKSMEDYIITEKVVVVEFISDDELLEKDGKKYMRVYNDVLSSKMIDEISYERDEEFSEIQIDDYLDEASTYQYTFHFDGENFIYKELKKIR